MGRTVYIVPDMVQSLYNTTTEISDQVHHLRSTSCSSYHAKTIRHFTMIATVLQWEGMILWYFLEHLRLIKHVTVIVFSIKINNHSNSSVSIQLACVYAIVMVSENVQ